MGSRTALRTHRRQAQHPHEIGAGPQGLKGGKDPVTHKAPKGNDPVVPFSQEEEEGSKPLVGDGFRGTGKCLFRPISYDEIKDQDQEEINPGDHLKPASPSHNSDQDDQGARGHHVSQGSDGENQAWWPGEACVAVENGMWQMVARLGEGEVPAELDRSAQYMLRVFQQNGPNIVAVFAFDLAGPPTAEP